jgi:hypothetical protein
MELMEARGRAKVGRHHIRKTMIPVTFVHALRTYVRSLPCIILPVRTACYVLRSVPQNYFVSGEVRLDRILPLSSSGSSSLPPYPTWCAVRGTQQSYNRALGTLNDTPFLRFSAPRCNIRIWRLGPHRIPYLQRTRTTYEVISRPPYVSLSIYKAAFTSLRHPYASVRMVKDQSYSRANSKRQYSPTYSVLV